MPRGRRAPRGGSHRQSFTVCGGASHNRILSVLVVGFHPWPETGRVPTSSHSPARSRHGYRRILWRFIHLRARRRNPRPSGHGRLGRRIPRADEAPRLVADRPGGRGRRRRLPGPARSRARTRGRRSRRCARRLGASTSRAGAGWPTRTRSARSTSSASTSTSGSPSGSRSTSAPGSRAGAGAPSPVAARRPLHAPRRFTEALRAQGKPPGLRRRAGRPPAQGRDAGGASSWPSGTSPPRSSRSPSATRCRSTG